MSLINTIKCSCANSGSENKKTFTNIEANLIFSNIYRENDVRCIICKLNLIKQYNDYPLLNKNGTEKRDYELDHMMPYYKYKNNCLQHNIVPICTMCNNSKSYTRTYIEFLIVCLIISKQYYDTKLKQHYFDENNLKIYLKEHPNCVCYSEFITNEMTPIAKMHQLKLVRKYFWDYIGWEPNYDLIYQQDGDFILSPISKNQKFLYYDRNNYVSDDIFILVITIMRKLNIKHKIYPNDKDFIELILKLRNNLWYSDFIIYDMSLVQIVENLKLMIEYFSKLKQENCIDFEPIYNISYSHFITNDMNINEKTEKLNNIQYIFTLNNLPIIDNIINIGNDYLIDQTIKNIINVRPKILMEPPLYNEFGQ